jgi:Spy/CpxP family protein refolding chaperone
MTMKAMTMKRIVAMATLVALIPVSGWAYGPQGEGKRKGPSPQSLEACAQKSVGDAVEFTTRRGELRSAVCQEVRGQLVAVAEGREMRGHRGERMERIAQALELSDTQREEIAAIRSEQRQKTAPLRQQMMQNKNELRTLTGADSFDEAAVRSLATAQAELKTEMIVARAETRSRIHALLTPEQREKADELMAQGKKGKRGFCCRM